MSMLKDHTGVSLVGFGGVDLPSKAVVCGTSGAIGFRRMLRGDEMTGFGLRASGGGDGGEGAEVGLTKWVPSSRCGRARGSEGWNEAEESSKPDLSPL